MKKITLLFILFFSCLSFGQNLALNFDGTSGQYVDTTPMLPYSNTFTVMGWVNETANNAAIFTWGSPTLNEYIQVTTQFSGKLKFYIPTGSGINISSTTTITGGWHHIAVTSDAGSVTVYVDGNSEATGSYTKTLNPTVSSFGTSLFNGAWQLSNTGAIDEMSIWSIALTGTQVNAFKTSGPTGTETGLLAAYNFNESGVTAGGNNAGQTTLTDLSGNYPGTLVGFPLTGTTGNWVDSGSAVLAIDKVKKEFNFSLYPNPTSNFVNLNYANTVRINKLQLFNSVGSLVKEFNNTQKELNIAHLPTGFYFLQVDSNKGIVNYKIIKE